MERQRGRAVVAGLLVLLTGCAPLDPTEVGKTAPIPDSSASQTPDAPDGPGSTDDSASADSPQVLLEPCADVPRAGMEQTVTRQTEAFAVGDFERAYTFASPSFQATVSLESFSELISESYGPLTATAELRFGDCLINVSEGYGTLDARFDQDGAAVFGLRYVLRDTPEGWRVDGASSLEVIGGGT